MHRRLFRRDYTHNPADRRLELPVRNSEFPRYSAFVQCIAHFKLIPSKIVA